MLKGATVDENGLIGFPVSDDMGWQKRGKGHNSLTGHVTAMGLNTGNVLAYATTCKSCVNIVPNATQFFSDPV